MKYGGLTHGECEVVVRLDRETGMAHVSASWPEWGRRLERMWGPPSKVFTQGEFITCAKWVVPLDRVLLRRGKKPPSKPPSEAQREARRTFGERRKQARLAPQPNTTHENLDRSRQGTHLYSYHSEWTEGSFF